MLRNGRSNNPESGGQKDLARNNPRAMYTSQKHGQTSHIQTLRNPSTKIQKTLGKVTKAN
jgi:hypothetical protein